MPIRRIDYGAGMQPTPIALQTLPSWPTVAEPTLLESLTLMVFIPVGVAALLTVLVLGRSWGSKS